MSIKIRIASIVFLAILFYGVANLLIQKSLIFPSFMELEHTEATKSLDRWAETLQRETRQLKWLCGDYSLWDDTYAFMADPKADSLYLKSNFSPTTFKGSNMNLVMFYSLDGKLVWHQYRNIETGEILSTYPLPAQLPQNHPFRNVEEVGKHDGGLLRTPYGPLMIVARPITDTKSSQPPRGIMVMGRLLSESVIQNLARQNHLRLTMQQIDPKSKEQKTILAGFPKKQSLWIDAKSNQVLQAYSILPDLLGKNAFLVDTKINRDISVQGARVLNYASLSLILTGILVLIIVLYFLQKSVIRPIVDLTNHASAIGQMDDLTIHFPVNRTDEIGILAREFNTTMDRLEHARKKALEKSFHMGLSEMAHEVLHNVRNDLDPIVMNLGYQHRRLVLSPLKQIQQARSEIQNKDIAPERQEELASYLGMAVDNLTQLIQKTTTELGNALNQIAEIDQVLAAQEKMGRTDWPVEKIHVSDLLTDALDDIPTESRNQVVVDVNSDIKNLGIISGPRIPLLHVIRDILIHCIETSKNANTGLVQVRGDMRGGEIRRLHIQAECDCKTPPEDELERLFERGNATGKGFTTFGLHWCSNAIATMNGKMWAEPRNPEEGISIHILIPVGENC